MEPVGNAQGDDAQRPTNRAKRSLVACRRCHSQKIKCSGDTPCSACIAANKSDSCDYPYRERKIAVSEQYLKKLEADSETLRKQTPNSNTPVPDGRANELLPQPTTSPQDVEVVNPLFESRHTQLSTQPFTQSEIEHPFLGEAACDAFGDRLLQYVDKNGRAPQPPVPTFIRYGQFSRVPQMDYVLPDRIQAKLLLRVAMRFIGNGQFLFLKKSYLEELESIYLEDAEPSTFWLCKLFTLLALGEMYSNRKRRDSDGKAPGQDYFVTAVNMLQDLYEEATPLQVEVYSLFAWYSNALGRIRSAYTYLGISMRLALSLGMHRSSSYSYTVVTPVEREMRRRIWWSLYLFDRLTCSKLGQPVSVNDSEIDIALPSMDGLSPQEQEEFEDPSHLCASVGLARISGDILSDIYSLPGRSKGTFVQCVHRILSSLRRWDENLPGHLSFNWDGDTTNRHIASLHLCYNQCIIHTTRPILLFLFRTQFHLGARIPQRETAFFSPMTTALAESCVNAARTSNKILEKLFIDGTLATLGYWDAHYLFSSSLILTMSAVMEPNVSVSDTVQTAFSLLRSMRDDGNIPARTFCDRLALIQKRVSELRAGPRNDINIEAVPSVNGETGAHAADFKEGRIFHDAQPEQSTGTTWSGESVNVGNIGYGALANPYIDNFLAEKNFAWSSAAFPDDSTLQQFVSELGDDYLFPDPSE